MRKRLKGVTERKHERERKRDPQGALIEGGRESGRDGERIKEGMEGRRVEEGKVRVRE